MLLGSALVISRRAAGQSAVRIHRVGLLNSGAPVADASPFGAPLVRGLDKQRYTLGRDLTFERRGAEGQPERLPGLMAELIASRVEAIVAFGYPAAAAAKAAGSVPVVAFGTGDPIGTGLVESLSRPGGNVTGISDVSAELAPKRLSLLKEAVPGLRRVAMLWNTADPGMTLRYEVSASSAQTLGIVVQPLGVREPDDFRQAFAAMEREPPDAAFMVADPLTVLNRRPVMEFAAARRLPVMYEFDFIVRDGGLMSYGPDLEETFERVAALVVRILKGASPADLPFEQPTRFHLAINMKTAAAIGLTVAPSVLARADEVIE
jgi:putative ABC transport system substrate-binding protein